MRLEDSADDVSLLGRDTEETEKLGVAVLISSRT